MRGIISLAAIAVLGLAAGSARAADLATKEQRLTGCQTPFQGFYIGGNAGGSFWKADRPDGGFFGGALPILQVGANTAPQPPATTDVLETAGVVAGGQAGYNWSSCNVVLGLEFEGDWSNARVTSNRYFFPPIQPALVALAGPASTLGSVSSSVNQIYMLKARMGMVIFDRLLIYGTGGAANARFDTTYSTSSTFGAVLQALPFASIAANGGPFAANARFSENRWGWVVGAGAEYAWTDRITIRSETLFAAFPERVNSTTVSYTGAIATALGASNTPRNFGFSMSDSMVMSKIGINFKLGSSNGSY